MTFMTHIRPSVLSVLLAFLALVGPAVVTEAETRFVANNGVDSNNTCVVHPCRSVGHAIQNANSGDTIVVGPGRYSWESEPGPGFCSCVIQVDKPLTIESRDGAGVTVLDATGHPVNVVQIEASDVIFGELQKGFTLTGAVSSLEVSGSGLAILAGTSGVQVRGNLATRNNGPGFDVEGGNGHHLRGNTASANGASGGFFIHGNGHHLRGNTASLNGGAGFEAVNTGNEQGHVLKGNVATANASDGFRSSGEGFPSVGNSLLGNVATANDSAGFLIASSVLTGNIASANGFSGFSFFQGGTNVLTGNAALGNKGPGIVALEGGSGATITQNNIFGNDSPPSTNCGLDNLSGGAINATDNFWGTAHGPGTLTTPQPEPADNVCDDTTNHPGSSTSVAPFATKKFTVETPLVEPGL